MNALSSRIPSDGRHRLIPQLGIAALAISMLFALPDSAAGTGVGSPTTSDGLVVLVDGLVVGVDVVSGDRVELGDAAQPSAVARHVASVGRDYAFVQDRRGPDDIVISTPSGTRVVEGFGEVTHPSWSSAGELAVAVDGQLVAVFDARGEQLSIVERPPGTLGVSAPVFTDATSIIAVVQEHIPGDPAPPSLDGLNNLYRLDVATGEWIRVTDFVADPENWSVIRTPVVTAAGEVKFVRITGKSTGSSDDVTTELWTFDGDGAVLVRELPPETYLAASRGETLVFNEFSYDDLQWHLYTGHDDNRRDLGIGTILVDPTTPDPDMPVLSEKVRSEDDPFSNGTLAPAIVVLGAASEFDAADIRSILGEQNWEVVRGSTENNALEPGSWAVMMKLESSEDPRPYLKAMRDEYPTLAQDMFITVYMP